jgi:hypothetical protein
MNKDYVLYNLDEAHKALGEIIADMRSNRDYDYGEYVVDMTHVYHHLNTAWNARGATNAAADECSEEDFYPLVPKVSLGTHLSWKLCFPMLGRECEAITESMGPMRRISLLRAL